MTMEYKLVIVVREDLDISRGKLAVQVAHASVECAMKTYLNKREIFENWYKEGQKKVVLKVKNLNDLFLLREKAYGFGIYACLIQDAGLTEVPPGTITVLGIGPEKENLIDKITGSLPLY
ncbi:MAG: peptidyl-tRNA hydrolase Pth2 [Thermoplasmata archaeon]|nr:peptidyl-tRNA hydrolase Pth2 [Thermoplasmata archaeon]